MWVHGPDAEPWEVYTVLADAPVMHEVPSAEGEHACCEAAPVQLGTSPSTCC